MYRGALLLILSALAAGNSIAQPGARLAAAMLSSSSTPTATVYHGKRNEPPRAFEFKERTVTTATFFANINRYLDVPDDFTFVEAASNTDELGMTHHMLEQHYKGIRLEGMVYRVHEKDGFVKSANGRAVRDVKVNTEVLLTEQSAFHLAARHLQTKDTVIRPGTKLIVSQGFTFMPESFFVAFQFDVEVSLIERWRISIDARSGEVVNKVSLVNTCSKGIRPPGPSETGTGLTNYYGRQSVLVSKYSNGASTLWGQTQNGVTIHTQDFRNASVLGLFFGFYQVYDFYSDDNSYDSHYEKPAVSVQWGAEQVSDYYFEKHNRNSFDNNGATITSYVHVDVNMNNAFWTGEVMAFGDGSNNNPLVELDVVAHEFTHGVTQHEGGLEYYHESGALNESFSDIFGKAVEFYTFRDTATWQLARHYRDGGLRDFSNPNLKNQPDTYFGDMWFTGYEDNRGVHYNSGVQNFWFYLLCEGGNGVNDRGISYSVNRIGMDTAANIAYRNLTEYLSYFSDYLDSRIGSLLAAADLYGKNSSAYREVANAWDAVGVIDEPIITDLQLYDITATTVKIKGNLLPRGDTVRYHFEYGTTPDLGSSSSVYEYTGTVEGVLTGLQSETRYYVRLVATNENGSSYHATEFTTISLTPLVRIRETVDVTETTATLYGSINPNSRPTSFYFEYGVTPDLGLVTETFPLSDTTEYVDISADVTGLQPRQTYYYKLVAANDFASAESATASFFTAVKPVITSYAPVAAPVDAEIVIDGHSFNPAPEKNFVHFGATRATVLSASSSQLIVKVPVGASLGPITVADSESGLITQSIEDFVPTFSDQVGTHNLHLTVGFSDLYIWATAVHDIDGDKRPDIVGTHYQGFTVFQNVNQGGDVTNESFVRNTFPNPDFSSGNLWIADMDGNGLKDVVGNYQNGLRVYPNLSVPGFVFFGMPVDLPMDNIGRLVLNDFDMDGHLDIAGMRDHAYDTSKFVIYRNENPKGSLSAGNFLLRYEKLLTHASYFLTAGDINNDGAPDLMSSAHSANSFSILKNSSRPGAFEFEEHIVEDVTRDRFARYIAKDLNQDRWKDIVAHSPYLPGNIALLENKRTSPDVGLEMPVIIHPGKESNVQPADITGDGKVDLLAAIGHREFIVLKNKGASGERLESSSFEKSGQYGLPTMEWQTVETAMTANDLNGDGRPEVINVHDYYYGPHEGYQMEIWQHSPSGCLDPSLITVEPGYPTSEIILPQNTSFEQFEMAFKRTDSPYDYWQPVDATTLYLSAGVSYQLRARAKCHLGFTGYQYIDFTTECVDLASFSITKIDIDYIRVDAYNLNNIEVQHSLAGKAEWTELSQNSKTISNLIAGTNYDLRFRGRCATPGKFKYKEFTTLCPKLSSLEITELSYNRAVVGWASTHADSAILEYSEDNVTWKPIDETQTIFQLVPGTQYFVRGRLSCTDVISDFIYHSFTTPCPEVSSLSVDPVTPFTAKVNWVDESATGSYTLVYNMTSGSEVTTIQTNSTSVELTGLNPGTQYSVAVAPHCLLNDDFTLTVFTTVCYSPFYITLDSVTHTTARLSWQDDFSAGPYTIDYSIVGSDVWRTAKASVTNVSLTHLRPGTPYEARVHITCPDEIPPYVSLVFETALYGETAFGPNPTDGKITLYPSRNLIGNRFTIHDNAGREVVSAELLDYTIDLKDLSPGVYALRIAGEKMIKIVRR